MGESDNSQNINAVDWWDAAVFLKRLRDRFGFDVEGHLDELTAEERARLQQLNEKLKEESWRRS